MAEGDLAVRIRQDIVVLPDLDAYITQLMTRDRSLELYRYFHIEPPVDRGVRQTVVEKTKMLYHQCQLLLGLTQSDLRALFVEQ